MVPRQQDTQTKQHPTSYRSTLIPALNYGLKCLSLLILPLMLGTFTIVITFHQQNTAREQRIEDLQMARQQRLEDKKETQVQRRLEWSLAMKNQEAQTQAASERYRDDILVAYIKDIGDLLEKYNGSLTSNTLTHSLARVKTRSALRQLDGSRQTHIIRFLYETGELSNMGTFPALDMTTTQLIDIDFREVTSTGFQDIQLGLVSLRNCTFTNISLHHVDFWAATLDSVNFSSIQLSSIDFSSASFNNVNFSSTWLFEIDFSYAKKVSNTKFSAAAVFKTKFLSADLDNTNFSSATFSYVTFSSAKLRNVTFAYASIAEVDFSSALLENLDFSFATLSNTTFSPNNKPPNIGISFPWFRNISFSSAQLYNVDFSHAKIFNVNFSFARFINVNASSDRLGVYTNFHHARVAHAIFVKCDCNMASFVGANLKNASFHSAMLSGAIFSLANLQNADFTNTSITDDQLQSALSIRNAKLPNGTLGQARNLVKNGDANCNIPLANHWIIRNGDIAVMVSNEDRSGCQFSLQPFATEAIMSQRVILTDIWDSSVWTYSTVQLQARISSGISIELIGKSRNGAVLDKHIADLTNNKIIMKLQKNMQELDVVVKFNTQNNKSNNDNIWCDNIEVFIDYDRMEKD